MPQSNDEAGEVYAAPGAFDPAATRAALARLDAPVLLLAGELDGGPRPRVAAEVARLIPRAEVAVLPATGHFPWLDDPGLFVRAVTRFLAGSSQRPSGTALRPAGSDGVSGRRTFRLSPCT
ncbi:alpha/beta fold hydrolase [Streptomyces sp. NPDC060194]|uniref:alpha/beta fold hydrolase n=1 Tax=Streptomyces sp. NPDC060194 TaxID=3347069 RepID=UPI0036566F2B